MIRNVAAVFFASISILAADPTVTVIGIGTRAFGMANNFSALANDFSAIFWNPAGMAFVPVREVHLAMDVNRQEAVTRLGDASTAAWSQRYRASSGGLLRALPTTRGGFAFALGFSSPYLLDDLYNARGHDVYHGNSTLTGYEADLHSGDTLYRDKYDYAATGGCNLWSAGMGWQIAPGLGFGFAVGMLLGSEDRELRIISYCKNKLFENYIRIKERAYLGYDARIGLLYTPVKGLWLGCRLELPRMAKVAQNMTEIDYAFEWDTATIDFGVLKSGFSGAFGAAVQTPYTTISVDATFRSPISGAPKGSDPSYWKEGIGAGIEIPIRPLASVLRGGYSYAQFDLSPMRIDWDENPGESPTRYSALRDRHLYTAGYSLMLGNRASLDLAYGQFLWEFSSTQPDWPKPVTERHDLGRGAMSISIRY